MRTEHSPRVVVVGGGLAGMAAAVALESVGINITLIEARRTLGGRAGSFPNPQTGEELDNCQHVLLGCCTNLLDFYRRIGATDRLLFDRKIHFLDANGRRYDLQRVPGLPAPLHLAPAMAQFNLLTWPERIALARAMMEMLSLGVKGREALADVPFGQWLDENEQPPSLVHKLYDPILVGGLNENTRDASAMYAIKVFQDSLLSNSGGYVLGLPACPLGQLYSNLPCRDVRTGTRVAELRFSAAAVTGVELASGDFLEADAIVLATNYHAVQRWIPQELANRDSRFARLDRLENVPILGVHLWFDRPVMAESHVALVDGPLQWLFRKDADGRALHGVISAARDWVNRPKEECLAMFEAQVRSLFPAARDAKLQRGVVIIEKRGTFSPAPGSDCFRPAQSPPHDGIRNLYLAGDYTKTGWPATMEGAVRSGYLAAQAIADRLGSSGIQRNFLVDDLPIQWPARLMGHQRGN